MRTIGLLVAIGMLASPANATNYYVSTNGSNSNAGSLAQPFMTIQKAADMARAGDNVYVMGGTYRETVTAAYSGAAGAPITFQPYQGARVTITGLDPVNTGWTTTGGAIYSSPVSGGVSQVFVNGQLMLGARWPNAVYNNPLRAVHAAVDAASLQTSPTASTITDAALSGTTNWAGAKMSITSGGQWVAAGANVIGKSGSTLSFEWPYPRNDAFDPVAGNPYYLYGTLAALDSAKEWHYDSAAGTLYLNAPGSTNPNNQAVEVRNRQYGFDLGAQSNISIKGFQLKAANIKIDGNFNQIDRCQILYPTAFSNPGSPAQSHPTPGGGVEISGQHNVVSNSEIGCSWTNGVMLQGANNTIVNNVIHDVDWLGVDSAFVNSYNSGGNNSITNNTMYNAGRSGIQNAGDSSSTPIPNLNIQNNDISRFGLLTGDLGGIYTSKSANAGSVIAYNRIHDGGHGISSNEEVVGIYLDNYSSGFDVHNNLVYNVYRGITVNKNADSSNPNNHNVFNNTLWNVTQAMGSWGPDGFVLTNVKTYNNLSNDSTWVGTDIQRNRAQTANQFANSAGGDYSLTANNPFAGKRAVDYGMTDSTHPAEPYTGSAPDAGAFESGITPWTAGANWKTWLFSNQTVAPLTSAISVSSSSIRTTTGSLVVGNTTGVDNRAYLKFNLSGIGNVPIAGAVLRIYENADPDSPSGNVSLYRVVSTWTDANVAFNQSVDASKPISGFYDPANLDLYADIDVTSVVRAWISAPETNFGFSLHGAEGVAGTAKYFEGLYGTTVPQLVITYAVPEPGMSGLTTWGGVCGVGVLAWRKRGARRNVPAMKIA